MELARGDKGMSCRPGRTVAEVVAERASFFISPEALLFSSFACVTQNKHRHRHTDTARERERDEERDEERKRDTHKE